MERGRRPAIALGQLLVRWSSSARRVQTVGETAGRNQRAFPACASDLERSGTYRPDLHRSGFPAVRLRDLWQEPAIRNDSLQGGLKFEPGSALVSYQPVRISPNWWLDSLSGFAARPVPLGFPVPESTAASLSIPALAVPSAAHGRDGLHEGPGYGSAVPLLASSVKRKRRKKMNKHKEKKRRRRDKNKR
ncbi:unnamed protein product [Closterium sp. NIES-53]